MASTPSNNNAPTDADGTSRRGRIRFESTRTLWERRRDLSAVSTAAVIIVIGNIVTLATLPWTQPELFGSTNPAIWLSLGLLIPIALISASLYQSYWRRVADHQSVIDRLGPYLLKTRIGSGGMGDVFLAEHQLMKRRCAVKLIHSDRARDQEMRESFEREAKATAQLTHWNTVEVYDYGTSDDGRFYYVMEYLDGVNLAEFVQQFGPMSPCRVAYILKQLCNALYEAECIGLVHRDIKPSNIFLTQRGRSFDVAKLLDFGLVHAACRNEEEPSAPQSRLRGSPAFMCPEQALGQTPDSRGDLYSLGCVAYHLLTGHPPFVEENPIMLIVAHATTDVPGLSEIDADVPKDLASVIMKCLARKPEERFQSARQLLEALELCDCSEDWSWRRAEIWWDVNQPSTPALADANATFAEADTLELYDRETAHGTRKPSEKSNQVDASSTTNTSLPTPESVPLESATIADNRDDDSRASRKQPDYEQKTVIYEPVDISGQ